MCCGSGTSTTNKVARERRIAHLQEKKKRAIEQKAKKLATNPSAPTVKSTFFKHVEPKKSKQNLLQFPNKSFTQEPNPKRTINNQTNIRPKLVA